MYIYIYMYWTNLFLTNPLRFHKNLKYLRLLHNELLENHNNFKKEYPDKYEEKIKIFGGRNMNSIKHNNILEEALDQTFNWYSDKMTGFLDDIIWMLVMYMEIKPGKPDKIPTNLLKRTLLMESHPTNFGHEKIIWKGNIFFPPRDKAYRINITDEPSDNIEDYFNDDEDDYQIEQQGQKVQRDQQGQNNITDEERDSFWNNSKSNKDGIDFINRRKIIKFLTNNKEILSKFKSKEGLEDCVKRKNFVEDLGNCNEKFKNLYTDALEVNSSSFKSKMGVNELSKRGFDEFIRQVNLLPQSTRQQGGSEALPYYTPNKFGVFDKQEEVSRAYNNNNLKPVENQKEFLEIYRVGYNVSPYYSVSKVFGFDKLPKFIQKPNNGDEGATLSISLFAPNNLENTKESWLKWSTNSGKNYFSRVIYNCLAYNYYQPKSNQRYYLDHYLLEKLKKNPEDFIEFSKEEWYDIGDKNDELKKFFDKFLEKINYYSKLQKFNNAYEKYMFIFDFATRCHYENDNLVFKGKAADFFVYKFKGPFIEGKGIGEGHVTNGFVGQCLRMIATRQVGYLWKNKTKGIYETIRRPTVVLNRDAHATGVGYADSKWIDEFTNVGRNLGNFYVLAHAHGYRAKRHDITCNDKIGHKGLWAGYCNFINFKDDASIINDFEWINTIGLYCLLNNENKLPLFDHRPYPKIEYTYGLDEYLLSNMLIFKETRQKSLLFNYSFFPVWWNLTSNDPRSTKTKMLLSYLLHKKLLKDKEEGWTVLDLVLKFEDIRENKEKYSDKNPELKLLLAVVPSIYNTLHTNTVNRANKKEFSKKVDLANIPEWKENYESDFKVNCKNSIYFSSELFCNTRSYKKFSDTLNDKNCDPANYFSGFYDDEPPSLDIGLLRNPKDLLSAVKYTFKNKLNNPLNKSNYKLKTEKGNLFEQFVSNSIDDGKSHIKATLQNVILNFGKNTGFGIPEAQLVAQKASLLNTNNLGNTQSSIWCPLIWKALNYNGYDVPPEWLEVKNVDNRMFNAYVKDLSNIKGWTEYAMEVLSQGGNQTFSSNDNSFESQKVKQLTSSYSQSYKGKNFNNLRMETFNKYMKYKKKYLSLKKNNYSSKLNSLLLKINFLFEKSIFNPNCFIISIPNIGSIELFLQTVKLKGQHPPSKKTST